LSIPRQCRDRPRATSKSCDGKQAGNDELQARRTDRTRARAGYALPDPCFDPIPRIDTSATARTDPTLAMKTLPWLFLLLAVGTLRPAQAGRPLQAEDAGVLERGHCEAEGVLQRQDEPLVPRAHATGLQLACGVGGSSQIALAALDARSGGSPAQRLRAGGKSELWRGAGNDAAAFTLAWGATAGRAEGKSWAHVGTDLNGVASIPTDRATWHLNLGHLRDPASRQRSTTWALAFERDSVGGWAPMAELFGDDRGAPWWNLGLRLTAQPDKLYFDLSYGRQVAPGRPSLLTAGFKFAI